MSVGSNYNQSLTNFSGISSGIDTQGIIQKLISIEQQPLKQLQQKIQDLSSQQDTYTSLGSVLSNLKSAADALNSSDLFNSETASSSDTGTATVTGGSSVTAGTYDLTVTQLAKAEKIASKAYDDTTSAVNQSGTFVVNGQTVTVNTSDSLSAIATKINNLGNGVTASVINGGVGSSYLTLTSGNTGVANELQIADTSGGVLAGLGLLSGLTTVRSPITNGGQSIGFSSQSDPLTKITNNTNLTGGTIQINGQSVTINPTDSLSTIAANINNAGANATAKVISTTTNGTTSYQLQITGTNGATPTFTDANNILATLGFVQQGYSNELVKAQDAKYSLDNVNLTSATNTITQAVPGATISLLRGTYTDNNNVTKSSTSTITVSRDTSSIKSKIDTFVSAYNTFIDYIAQNSTFDSKSFQTGPLFGDSIAEQALNETQAEVFNQVQGLTGQFSSLAGIGFTIDSSNHLTYDSTKLNDALTSNADNVARIFNSSGQTSSSNLKYISSTSKTHASGAGSYDVQVTQLATQSTYSAPTAQTSNTTNAESITFNGSLFSNTNYSVQIPIGSSQSDIVSLINSDSKLKDVVTASVDGNGKLQITSKQYGAGGDFTVVSSAPASSSNSGLGTDFTAGTHVAGLDIAGTINGEAATGSGQFLTGNSGNATTDGLQIQYTGVTTGDAGTVQFTKGIGSQTSDLMNTFTDSSTGLIKTTNASIQTEIDTDNILATQLQQSLLLKQQSLQQTYANMESLIAQLKQQSQQIGH